MSYIWRNEYLIERECDWCGINGNHYERNRFIGAIFYTMEDITNNKPYLTTGGQGVAIGGGGMSKDRALQHINRCLAKGQKPVTIEELNKAIDTMREDIKKNPEYYRENCD